MSRPLSAERRYRALMLRGPQRPGRGPQRKQGRGAPHTAIADRNCGTGRLGGAPRGGMAFERQPLSLSYNRVGKMIHRCGVSSDDLINFFG